MAVIQQNTPWLYTPIQPIFNYCYIWTMGNTNVAHKPISCVMRYSTYLEKQNRNWTNFSPPGDINNDAPKRGKWACGSSCKHNICWHNNSRHWVRNDNHIKTCTSSMLWGSAQTFQYVWNQVPVWFQPHLTYPFQDTIYSFNTQSQPHSQRYMQYYMYTWKLNRTSLHVDAALNMTLLCNGNW